MGRENWWITMWIAVYISCLLAVGATAGFVYIKRYLKQPLDIWTPGAAWTRAVLYFVACNVISAATGTIDVLLLQAPVTAAQASDPVWIVSCIACFAYIFIAYWILWARMTLTFDRKYYIGWEILFGMLWGASTGQVMLSIFNAWRSAGLGGWVLYVVSFACMGAWQYFVQDYFWDVYVSPEHDTPRSIVLKTAVSHVPNVAICLCFLVVYGNYLLFIGTQAFALVAASIFQKFPSPRAKGHFDAPATKPGLFGLPHGAGYTGGKPSLKK